MKILLTLLLVLSATAHASTLETFFSALEGKWKSKSADSYRETTGGEILHSVGTKFESEVVRKENRWSFSEESCWRAESGEATCGKSDLAYVVTGDELTIEMEGKSYPVTILESEADYLAIMLSTDEYVFTAVVTREGDSLTQDAVMELANGEKVYEFFELKKL